MTCRPAFASRISAGCSPRYSRASENVRWSSSSPTSSTPKRQRVSACRWLRWRAGHVVVFAALKTPLLSALPRRPIGTMLDAARHAVAHRVLREREQAVHSLQRGAVHVLDVEPSHLTVPLINQYVDLRRRNTL